MSRSTKLASAAYILSFVAAKHPEQVTTDAIAEAVRDHPTRVRQIVSMLGKAGLTRSVRGAAGGVVLAREASGITLRDVYEAVEDQPLLSLGVREAVEAWAPGSQANAVLADLFAGMEGALLERLATVPLTALYSEIGPP